ncbi:MAG: DUF938 domain-containing protein [Deltaproteobacteria bacterium]|nr:DUF938 domain-containing protein [Deltaproteobacteria bacterium]
MRPTCEASDRNKAPIADVLARWVPPKGRMLEVASGTGQHATYFAGRFPNLIWQPTDPDPEAREAIESRCKDRNIANLSPPLDLDVCVQPWAMTDAQGLVCVNLLHIAPWSVCEGLFAGGRALLVSGAPCVIYGPFRLGGVFNSAGNQRFDATLRARNPALGLRDVEAVVAVADAAGFDLREQAAMPANNLTLVFTGR